MTDSDALTILEHAHRRCGTEDMRTFEVFAALHHLQASAELLTKVPETWPFDQFRHALRPIEEPFTVNATRGQVVNAALNGIRRVCRMATPRS